jgi:tetratricopeptide (TPR) repeat protein
MKKLVFLVFVAFHFLNFSQSESSKNVDAKTIQDQSKKLKRAIDDKNDVASAESLLRLGETFEKKGDYKKSETYYQQALNIYEKEKDKKNIAKISRTLAVIKEKLNQDQASSVLYEQAADNSEDKVLEKININDARRINAPTASKKEALALENINSFKNENQKEEIAAGYSNLGTIQANRGNYVAATQNFQRAYDEIKTLEPQKAIEINQKIVTIQKNNQMLGEAIKTQNKFLTEDFVKTNSKSKVEALQTLATLYTANKDPYETLKTLEKAYQISLEKGHTLEARQVILKIDSLHKANNQAEKSLPFYRKFLKDLQKVLQKDESLMDERIIAETEEKIAQLLKERQLQNDLMTKQKQFNIGLIVFIALLILGVFAILYAYKKLQTKNKKIALQSLRREMNPHFIFNSLNSVNHFIAQNNELEANQYLSKFSKLMRGIMENSTNDFIPLATEIELIKNYLGLEKSRFQDKFDYDIKISQTLNIDVWQVPSMLIQPFIENAIWHGLRYKDDKGMVEVKFENSQNLLTIKIKDNGIGIAKSKAIKTKHQNKHKGRGMDNTLERIKLLNELYNQLIKHEIHDSETGVTIILKIKKV